MKLKKSDADLMLLLVTLEEWPIMNHQIYIIIKYCIICYLLVKYANGFLYIIQKKQSIKFAVFLLIFFMASSTLSTIQYTHKFTWGLSALMNALCYIVYFEVLYSITIMSGIKHVIKVVLLTLLSVLAVNDLLMVIISYDFKNPSEQYLIGNKFAVSYYHCFLFILSKAYSYLDSGKNKKFMKLLPVILFVTAFLVCSIVHCATGVVISVVSIILLILPDGIKNILYNRVIIYILLFVENIAIFGSTQLFRLPFIQSFFVNVLGKTSNMTGRFRIYAVLDEIIAKKPYFGYGYNTVTDIVTSIVKYGNAQNGLKQLLIQYGIIGTALLLSSLYLFLEKSTSFNKDILAFYVMIFALIIASTVEISLSSLFVFTIALTSAGYLCYENQFRGVLSK